MAPNLSKTSDDILTVGGFEEPSAFALRGRSLTVHGYHFLLDVPPNITLANNVCKAKDGCFVGFSCDTCQSRHIVPLDRLLGIRFMSIFRFKVWWTTLWVGNRGRDVENETQFLMLDHCPDSGRPYVLLLPLVDGPFRASLQPGPGDNDYVDICVESGSTQVASSAFGNMHAGHDPFALGRAG